jgi:hypothetical protein
MTDYSFRVRVELAARCGIATAEAKILLAQDVSGAQIQLIGADEQPISSGNRLILKASGWPTRDEALAAGQLYADALMLACVRSRIGAEFWPRRGGGQFFASGLHVLEGALGRRVLNDTQGLMVFETEPPPKFVAWGGTAKLAMDLAAFQAQFQHLVARRPQLNERERLAVDLFNASFFEPASDTRLLVLMMAVEALIEREDRSLEAQQLLGGWEDAARASPFPQPERDSLAQALRGLRRESIGSAGRRLVTQRLGGQQFLGKSAAGFFDHCYALRSRLVHSDAERPRLDDVGPAAAQLEVFVSELITAPLWEGAA